jgi:DNA replication initiation complex subunit (GINS family)
VELYDRREKKIINLALYRVKAGDGIINTEMLLSEERIFFDTLYMQLLRYREDILNNVLEGKIPNPHVMNMTLNNSNALSKITLDIEDLSEGIKSVRFIKAVPRFLGSELEVYGPFVENDIASLPSKIANILIKKDRAEEMHIN